VAGYSFPATLLFVRCTVCLYPPHMRTIGVVLRRPKVLICLFVGVSVAAFLVPVDVISAHEGDEGSVVVHVTDEGFEPRSVEIQSGDTVVFENVGDETHWPASDDHPTHEEYSAFDPKKPIRPNTEWSFTFDRLGKWEYHDHMNPYLMGEVVVLEKASGHESFFSPLMAFLTNAYERTISALVGVREDSASAGKARAEASRDESSEERYEERKDEFLALVRDENPRVALDRMREEIETNDALSRSCHALVHEIGRAAYEKHGDFGEAMKYRDELCNSGYLHGVIESHFSQSEDVFAEMKTMCDGYRQSSYLSWQCYHGLGHGVMFYTANDLPRSLEMCERFKSDFGRTSCVNGVFMENFNTEQKLHVSKFLTKDDPFYPCPKQPERYKSDCYLYAPTYFLNLNHDDYAGALDWCEGAEAGYESTCSRGVGGETMKENMNDPKFVEATCMSGGPQQVVPCVEGMVGLYINHSGSLEPARELCAELEVSNQRTCYGTVETYAGLFRS
jgi:plastocyanin